MSITVITGSGKGKTTGALGMALLALGEGKQAAMVQFLKGNGYTGELFAAQRVGLRIYQYGWGCPWSSLIRNGTMQCLSCGDCFRENRNPKHNFASLALDCVGELTRAGNYGLLVLDEVSHALRRGLIDIRETCELLTRHTAQIDFILTGRHMPREIMDLADTAYELKQQKHPFTSGIASRRGIEY